MNNSKEQEYQEQEGSQEEEVNENQIDIEMGE